MVILGGGLRYAETEWAFPEVNECPHRGCVRNFSSCALTKKHYQQEHAKNATLCKVCDKPISAVKLHEHEQTAVHRSMASKKPHIPHPVDSFFYFYISLDNIDLKH